MKDGILYHYISAGLRVIDLPYTTLYPFYEPFGVLSILRVFAQDWVSLLINLILGIPASLLWMFGSGYLAYLDFATSFIVNNFMVSEVDLDSQVRTENYEVVLGSLLWIVLLPYRIAEKNYTVFRLHYLLIILRWIILIPFEIINIYGYYTETYERYNWIQRRLH